MPPPSGPEPYAVFTLFDHLGLRTNSITKNPKRVKAEEPSQARAPGESEGETGEDRTRDADRKL